MSDQVLTPDTQVRMPIERWWKVAVGIAGLVSGLYLCRDRAMADVRQLIAEAVTQERAARVEAESHLLQKEDFQKAMGDLRTLIIERTK